MPINEHDKEFDNKDEFADDIFAADGSDPFDSLEHDWTEEWTGMPEFNQPDKPPYQCIKIRFHTKEEYEEFAKLIDQNLTIKTKSIWYPALDRGVIKNKRYVDGIFEVEETEDVEN